MIGYKQVICTEKETAMQYCEFLSDKSTLLNIESNLMTEQQQHVFKIYLDRIENKKHPYSFLDFYQDYIEKHNLQPDVNMSLLNKLTSVQGCKKIKLLSLN